MSFGESVFSAGFNQKTAKEDLFVKEIYRIPPRNRRGKALEDSRRLSPKRDTCHPTSGRPAPGGLTCQPRCYIGFSPPPRIHLHRLFKSIWSKGSELTLRPIYTSLHPSQGIIKPSQILRAEKPETLIHMSTRI
jgi:hypothetical protein